MIGSAFQWGIRSLRNPNSLAKIVSERLGHSFVGITLDTYSHVLPGMQEDAANKLETALRSAIESC